jgi:hypothetical protein
LADTLLWAKWIFFAPGDFLFYLIIIYVPAVAIFLGLGATSMYGVLSGILSFVLWTFIYRKFFT